MMQPPFLQWLVAAALVFFSAAVPAAEFQPWKGDAPAFELKDLQGRTQRLADYKGKVLLVNFWATWCEPCREEMPSLERLRKDLAGKPFEIVAINLGEPRSRIDRFLEKMPLSLPILLDSDSSTSKAWKAKILPATFLIGRDGRIRFVHYGELDWSGPEARKRIEALLK